MSTAYPRLHEQVRIVVGMDDAPLALHTGTGTYHRLSRPAAALLRLFDGTRSTDEVAGAVAVARRQEIARVRAELDAFLGSMARAGLLAGAEAPARPSGRARRGRLLPRFVVTRSLPRLLEPVARLMRPGWRAEVAMAVLTTAGLVGAVLGTAAYVSVDLRPGGGAGGGLAAVGLAALLLLTQICVHETMHALACQVLGTPVRGAGFALLLWLVPVAYVDRTDAYLIRRRGGRVALAVAGPLSDGVAMGVTGFVALSGGGYTAAVAGHLLLFQAFTLLLNVNPLLPTDAYVAVEAAFGLVDPRGRAFALLHCLVRRRPLPAYLAALTPRARRAHVVYGIACVAYLGVFVFALVNGVLSTVGHLIGALG